ncbi:MAG: hypothetical protein ACREJO_08375 [Phycisphaerales bacterium]
MAPSLRPLVTDDRGRRVPLVRTMLALVPWGSGPLPRKVQSAVRTDLMKWSWSKHNIFRRDELWYGALIGIMPAVLSFGPLFISMALDWPPGWWRFAVIFPGTVLMFLLLPEILWRLMPPSRCRLVADAVLKHGCCASCGYGLDVASVQDDGCCVCPECGAAWKVPATVESRS